MDTGVGQSIASFIKSLCSPDRSFLFLLQESFVSENKPLCADTGRSFYPEDVVKLEKQSQEEDEIEGTILFRSGELFRGLFKEDLTYCQGKLFTSAKSELGTSGTWTGGRLTGLSRVDNQYGGGEECFFVDGVRHGVSVEFGPNRRKHFMKFCYYESGSPTGLAIRGLIGGVLIFGKVSSDAKISDKKAAVLMPDLRGAFEAIVVEDEFVRGQQVEVVDIRYQDNLPLPTLSPPLSQTVYRRDVSTALVISRTPLVTDPWERERVEARASEVEGAGEGLFARRRLERGELVALYNGTRSVPSLYEDWSDYRSVVSSQ